VESQLERYKKDLDALIAKGEVLAFALLKQFSMLEYLRAVMMLSPKERDRFLGSLPLFTNEYQPWYSEAMALVRQLLPDRLEDFISHYKTPTIRSIITMENYRIEDFLQGLEFKYTSSGTVKLRGPDAAITHFQQQLAIVKAVNARFESALFDIRQLVQADLFDSELEAASELLKHKFTRAAGALAGVVLERHLVQVCENHHITIKKESPSISYLNDLLKNGTVIDTTQWRYNQRLGDIRNLCDHCKKSEPTKEEVEDLIAGVTKVIKSIF